MKLLGADGPEGSRRLLVGDRCHPVARGPSKPCPRCCLCLTQLRAANWGASPSALLLEEHGGQGGRGEGDTTGRARGPKDGQRHSDVAWDITSPGTTHSQRKRRLRKQSEGHPGEPRAQPSAHGSHTGPRRSRPGLRTSTLPRLASPLVGRRSKILLLLFNRNNNNYSEK